MRKIGKLINFFLILLFTLACVSASLAQDVEVEATLSETNIFSGEQVKLQITVSGTSMGSVEQPSLPEIEGLRWLRGSTSRGSSYSLINGQPSVTYTYGYTLIAQNPGEYTLPPIEVETGGKTYQTRPINFKVLDPAAVNSGESERSPDIYLRLEPNVESPVVGQQVIADVILYFKSGIEVSSYQPTPGWKAEGFWKEELDYPQRAQATSTIVNGVRYQKARLIQYALFPTKSGKLTLSPFEITVSVRNQRRSTDPFAFGLGQERMKLESIPVELNVKPLPDINDAQFIGAVGDFEITRDITPKKAFVGESIEIITRINGSGNVSLINKPEYDLPGSLEKYNPQESSSISRTNRQISGTRTFTDIVIARNEGTYTIPEVNVAHYNPTTGRYEITRLPNLSFQAEHDPDVPIVVQNDLRFSIEPITGLAVWTSSETTPLHQKNWVWILIFLPLFLTVLVFAYKKYYDRMNTDTVFARARAASSKAGNTLSKAVNVSDIKEGYHLIEKALIQYITDKLNLPSAGLSHKQIIEEVEKRTDPETTAELKRLLTKCETITYAPNASQETLDSDMIKTKELIKRMGKFS